MPIIEMAQKSYEVTQWGVLAFDWDKYTPPGDWVMQFSEYLFQHLSEDTKKRMGCTDINWVEKNIQRITNRINSNGKRVEDALIKIFAVMFKAVHDEGFRVSPDDSGEQILVAEKVAEGLQNCSQGCENRLNDILRFWQEPRDFAERLEWVRTEIVARFSRELSDETHAQNRISKIADGGVFGTKAINLGDEHRGVLKDKRGNELTDEHLMTDLLAHFKEEYTVLLSMRHIEEQIRSYLIAHEYVGKKSKGETYTAVYNRWKVFLNRIFSEKQPMEWLVVDDESNFVEDINWSLVRQEILLKLTDEALINNPDKTRNMFSILPENNREIEYWLSCNPSEEDIFKWLSTVQSQHEAVWYLLCFLPEDHPKLKTILSEDHHDSSNNNLSLFRQKWLKTPYLFKNTQFMLRIIGFLSTLDQDDLVQFLYSEMTQESILSELIQQGHAETIQSFFEWLKDKLPKEMIESLLAKMDSHSKNIWQVAMVSPEKSLLLVKFSQSLGITPPFVSLRNTFELTDLSDSNKFKKMSKIDARCFMELAFLCREDKNNIDVLLFLQICKFGDVTFVLNVFSQLSVEKQASLLKESINERNALMLAVHSLPGAFPVLLKVISGLDKGQQAEILKKTTANGLNALMLASWYQPRAVPDLLKVIAGLDKGQQAEILGKTTANGLNALMLASWYQPEAVPELLKAIGGLDKAQQAAILEKRTVRGGRNALMLAVLSLPRVVPDLLNAIAGLDKDQQAEILKKVDAEGWSSLLVASRQHPEVLPDLLKVIGGLDKGQQAEILLKTTTNGWNALMMAVQFQPGVVPDLLKVIGGLDRDQQAEILKKGDAEGLSSLLLASRQHPEVLPDLLKVIGELDKGQQAAILEKTTIVGPNALMLASYYHSGAVSELLKAIGGLSKGQQAGILLKTTTNGWNALMIAVYSQSGAVPELLKAIGGLEKGQQAEILLKTTSDGRNALMIAVHSQPGAVPELLKAIGGLDKAQQEKILGRLTDNCLVELINNQNSEKLLETLECLKGKHDTDVVIELILKFENFTPEDWYHIVNNNLIRSDVIKDKKDVVYRYIETLGTEKASPIIDNAMDKRTNIGAFFYKKRCFFECNENAGTLKKLKALKTPHKDIGFFGQIEKIMDEYFHLKKPSQ